MIAEKLNITAPENIALVHSGEDYFIRLEQMILACETEIHIQTYIFDADMIGTRIAEALKKAAARNVTIYLLLDGFGSKSLSNEFIDDLKRNGIHVRFFSPFLSANTFYIGRRLHHKIVVSDATTVLIGGINIADKYHGSTTDSPWLDYAVQVHCDAIGKPLQELCRAIYFKKRRIQNQKIECFFQNPEKMTVRILQNDWLKRKNEIQKAYLKSISEAKKEVVIVGSYFLPGRKLTNTLKNAAKNDVTVKLILSGISDVPLLRGASLYFYSKILSHNIELFEWNKSVLHGKTAVIDGHWTTIGSFNLNKLSAYASIEMNVSINSVAFSETYLSHLDEIISLCQKITPESLLHEKHYLSQYKNWLCYWTIRAILLIITYLPYKRFLKGK